MEKNMILALEIIERANRWFSRWLPGEKQKTVSLTNYRRSLKRKISALESNPALGIYGESQTGKSYLVNNLLSDKGKPFGITGNDGITHNFIEKINPPGNGTESTSAVSRFSVREKVAHRDYPVKVRILSVADLALALCDSFHNDIVHDSVISTKDIDCKIETLVRRYRNRTLKQSVISEDDMLDIQDYFTDNFKITANNLLQSRFFTDVPPLIEKIKSDEWSDVFSILWNENEHFTKFFEELIAEYKKLRFNQVIYLPIEAALYEHGTLLDIQRLQELYEETPRIIEPDYRANTPVLLVENGRKTVLASFSKSYLCALAAEVIFSLPESLLADKPFLADTDLLDFPGVRARKTEPGSLLKMETLPDLLIRGKVGYLFNKYSNTEKINILLLCAKHEQASQRSMPELLHNWICKTVGKSPEERQVFVNEAEIPPLFIISTFFNVNLEHANRDQENNKATLNYRWKQRFETTLANELINCKTYDWFTNWTVAQPDFNNIFLLRDFALSEKKSNLFRGFASCGIEKEEMIPENFPDFKSELRKSFIDYDFVRTHFENPDIAWDEAATINKDGTELIIGKLTKAARNINSARNRKICNDFISIMENLLTLLQKYYHNADPAIQLEKINAIAVETQELLDVAFGGANIYLFGQMMKELMVDDSFVYMLYNKIMKNPEACDITITDDYNLIRWRVRTLNPDDSFETNLERLCESYGIADREACKSSFEAKGIDLNRLFQDETEMIIDFPLMLARQLVSTWVEQRLNQNKESIMQLLSESHPGRRDIEKMVENIVAMFKRLFDKLNLEGKIAEKIRPHFKNGYIKNEAFEMIAGISAAFINEFINNAGYSDHADLMAGQNEGMEAAMLITQMNDLYNTLNNKYIHSPDSIGRLPNYRNYRLWSDRVKNGFIAGCDIPDYSVEANNELGAMISALQIIPHSQLALAKLIDVSPALGVVS